MAATGPGTSADKATAGVVRPKPRGVVVPHRPRWHQRLAELGEFVVRRERDEHLVAEAVHLDHDLGGQRFEELAMKKSDHRKL